MTIPRIRTVEDINRYQKEWPDSWSGLPDDLEFGKAVFFTLRPFLLHCIERYSVRTAYEHLMNTHELGGEIVRQAALPNQLDPASAGQMIEQAVEHGEGPLIRCFSESEQDRFDRTCRKLWDFLSKA